MHSAGFASSGVTCNAGLLGKPGESTSRHSVPKTGCTVAISRRSAARGRSVEDLARRVLELTATGREVPNALLVELANVVLDRPDVSAARRVLDGR